MKRALTILFVVALPVQGYAWSAENPAVPPAQGPSAATTSAPPRVVQIKLLPRIYVEMEKKDRQEPKANEMISVFLDGKEIAWSPNKGIMTNQGTQVRLLVKSEPGFRFVCWKELSWSIALKKVPPRLGRDQDRIRLEDDLSFVAENVDIYPLAVFSYNPDADQVDLIADYRAFLKELKLTATPAEADAFDRGDIAYFKDGTEKCVGNGVPDVAEFALVNAILKSGWIDFSRVGGGCGFFCLAVL